MKKIFLTLAIFFITLNVNATEIFSTSNTLNEKYLTIINDYYKCRVLQLNLTKEERLITANIRNELYARVECYINIANDLFDTFYTNNAQTYKNNLKNLVSSYSKVLSDKYDAMDFYPEGNITEDYIASDLEHFTDNLVSEYIKQTGQVIDIKNNILDKE